MKKDAERYHIKVTGTRTSPHPTSDRCHEIASDMPLMVGGTVEECTQQISLYMEGAIARGFFSFSYRGAVTCYPTHAIKCVSFEIIPVGGIDVQA